MEIIPTCGLEMVDVVILMSRRRYIDVPLTLTEHG